MNTLQLVLRREKTMRDAEGNPIIPLPPKSFHVEHLDLSPQERDIYDKVFKNAKAQYEDYAEHGTVLQNVVSILVSLIPLQSQSKDCSSLSPCHCG